MTKLLGLWKEDTAKMPVSPEEQITLSTNLLNMIKEDFKIGGDWGEFVGGGAGYFVTEGTEQEVALVLMKYSPYIKFKLFPVLSVEQVLENIQKISQAYSKALKFP